MEIIKILLLFIYILISAIDGTTKLYYVLPDKARNLKT